MSPEDWSFPVDLDVARKLFIFRHEKLENLGASTFLDTRHSSVNRNIMPVALSEIHTTHLERAESCGLILHTSFCCSTLLGRLLHVPGKSICLKEPLILRRLADAALNGHPDLMLIAASMSLLFRPPADLKTVLVKPTHVTLNIADAMLDAAPGTRSIIITSSLDSFFLSNIKKSEETKRKVPELVERFMKGSLLNTRLQTPAFEPPSFLCAVALQWYAQRQIVNDLLRGRHASAYRLIDEKELLSAPESTLFDVSEWLGMQLEPKIIRSQIDAVMHQHAKETTMPYSPNEKSYENNLLRSRFSQEIEYALDWSQRYLSPHLIE